ncbi:MULTISPECIES: xanthine dehydrogenase family protein molybdopterin-binding subunit [unclassified Pseudomonas]|uniref:xanthine dehydrogenase family protein molybdopterin-binding subunit n=1 Tax=unclassified Pseudomonas TaxID=196821 RepID=UPI0035C1F480
MTEKVIGVSQRRLDGHKKVLGAANYAADVFKQNLSYAYGVYSTIAHGRIVSIDERAATKMPGVIKVLHHGNIGELHRWPESFTLTDVRTVTYADEKRLPFEDDVVSYPGQFVALVIAETFEQARAAAQHVLVEYVNQPVIANLQQGLNQLAPKEAANGHSRGNVAQGLATAAHRIDVTYSTPVETHSPMEMHATTAWWENGRLYVYESTQGVINHRNVLAQAFNLSPDRVEVNAPFIGSGFGGKLFPWPHSIAACAAARAVKRPVQLVMPRAQMFTSVGHRPETQQRLRLGASASGKLVAISHESVNSTSVTDDFAETCGSVTKSLYSCSNVLVTHKTVGIHRGTPTSMRAPGAAPGLFALESAIDELAQACGLDPLVFRQQNIADIDESTNLPWSSNHLAEALRLGAARFGWEHRRSPVGSMREGDEVIGYGIGACNWEAFRLPAEARVTFKVDGTALIECGLQDIGTGTYTVLAQTVSELTGLPLQRIEVDLGSSTFPPGPLSGGSWVTASAMPAVAEATREALRKLQGFAVNSKGPFAGLALESLKTDGGAIVAEGRRINFADILKGQRLSRAEGISSTPGADTSRFSFRSFGVHFVEVRWDSGISRLRVSRVVSAIDVGKVVNPIAARNQVEGAIIMGIGMALFEAAEYDPRNGLPTNNNYAEYMVPVHADMPEIEVILLDYPDYRLNEFGVRGIGEIGVTGLAAAVANAVYHATGRRIRELPITMDKLMTGGTVGTGLDA